MSITNETPMPSDEELTVPQEITLSTPWLKAVGVYMARSCEDEIKEFMLLRKETEDPRKTLKEGARVTACGIEFLKKLKRTCADEATKYAECIDQSSYRMYINTCREPQRHMDRCVEEKLDISRPPMGYFSKLHVHESEKKPEKWQGRDYAAEAKKHLAELPKDYVFRDDYKRYQDYKLTVFEK